MDGKSSRKASKGSKGRKTKVEEIVEVAAVEAVPETVEEVPATVEEVSEIVEEVPELKAVNEEPIDDEETETAGMTDIQKRLFKVRMRMNQGRKVNRKEVENEYKRFSDPKFEGKQRYYEKQEELKKAQLKANKGKEIGREVGESGDEGRELVVGAGGVAGDDPVMLITAAAAERIHEKAMIKEKNMQTFGLQAQCSDATYKAYKKQLAKLPSSSSSSKAGGGSGLVDKEAQFTIGMKYGQGPAVSKAGVDRLSKDIVDHQEDRKKLSRRRMTAESDDVDFINDKNEAFNKKIKRSFDKYTVEIRQNLERGTAI